MIRYVRPGPAVRAWYAPCAVNVARSRGASCPRHQSKRYSRHTSADADACIRLCCELTDRPMTSANALSPSLRIKLVEKLSVRSFAGQPAKKFEVPKFVLPLCCPGTMHLLLSARAWRAWSLALKLHSPPQAGLSSTLPLSRYCAAILHNPSNPNPSSSFVSSPSFPRTMATQDKPPVLQELLQANEKYKSSFSKASLPLPPAKKVAVLACMDARLDPARALGLEVRATAAIAGGITY